MTISTAPFPLCCSAKVIYGFGGGHVGQIEDYSKKEAIVAIKKLIKRYKPLCAVLVAMPTSTQPNAYAALEELGFYHHPGGIDGGGSYAESKHKMSCMFLPLRSEEHTSELQSLMRISYAVFCLKKKKTKKQTYNLNKNTTI